MLAKGLPKIPYRITTQGFLQVGWWFPVIDLRSYEERKADAMKRGGTMIQAANERQLKAIVGTHGDSAKNRFKGLRGENIGVWNS